VNIVGSDADFHASILTLSPDSCCTPPHIP
jgi:hypothetical protein